MSENENGPNGEGTEPQSNEEISMKPKQSESTSSEVNSEEKIKLSADGEESAPQVDQIELSQNEEPQTAEVNQDNDVSTDEIYNAGRYSGLIPWTVDKDHATAIQILSSKVEGIKYEDHSDPPSSPSRALNFVLLVLILGVGFGGITSLQHYTSDDRISRLMEGAECVIDYNKQEQLIKETPRGTLRIESEPKQAKVYQSINGGPFEAIMGKTAEGKEMAALTPTTVQNMDINKIYRFKLVFTDTLKRPKPLSEEEEKERKKLKKEGKELPKREIEEMSVPYRDETFTISRYQWIQDGGTGSYRFQKTMNLIPQSTPQFISYNWKKSKLETFEKLEECMEFTKETTNSSICRGIQDVPSWEKEDERREEEAKKSKKRRRR
jgi:hypothetical protein